jgi:hypothetical protein
MQTPASPEANEPTEVVAEELSPPPLRAPDREPDVADATPPEVSRAVPLPEPEDTPPEPEDGEGQQRADMIGELLNRARLDVAALRLTRPAGDNAYERYQEVLALDPENPDALEGLQAIVERYHGLVEEALARGALDAAERHLESARSVDSGIDWLPPMQEAIERHRVRAARSPAPAVSSDREGDLEACLSGCEREHTTCREGGNPEAGAACVRERAAECDRRHDDCMKDVGQLVIWGRASLRSTCAGEHARCEREAMAACTDALTEAGAECDRRFEQCAAECRR